MKNRFFTHSGIHFVFAALAFLLAFLAVGAAYAAGDVGETAKQATNWTAIIMFMVFVLATLGITNS